MRTNRRGSVTIEAAMIIPVAIIVILLGRFVLESSLNRQETAVFARGSAISAAIDRSFFNSCDFERVYFDDHEDVDQSARVDCSHRDAEGGLSRERPMWDEVEDGAAPWDEILRDVKPRRSPRDIVARAKVNLTVTGNAFFDANATAGSEQSYLAPDQELWSHKEQGYDAAHSAVIWDELCKSGTYWLFPNVFPKEGGPRC